MDTFGLKHFTKNMTSAVVQLFIFEYSVMDPLIEILTV